MIRPNHYLDQSHTSDQEDVSPFTAEDALRDAAYCAGASASDRGKTSIPAQDNEYYKLVGANDGKASLIVDEWLKGYEQARLNRAGNPIVNSAEINNEVAMSPRSECITAIENANLRHFTYLEGDISIVNPSLCVRPGADEVMVFSVNGDNSKDPLESGNPLIWRGQARHLQLLLSALVDEAKNKVDPFHHLNDKKSNLANQPVCLDAYPDRNSCINSMDKIPNLATSHDPNHQAKSLTLSADATEALISAHDAFDRIYVDPLTYGNGYTEANKMWYDLNQLQSVMTDVGKSWLDARGVSGGRAADGLLVNARRLWCDGESTMTLLHHTDEFIAIVLRDNFQIAEIWAKPKAEALASSRGVSIEEAERRLSTVDKEIFDHTYTACKMVKWYNVDGSRDSGLRLVDADDKAPHR